MARGDNKSATDEWIRTAGVEYDQVAALANAQSLLGNAAGKVAPSSSPAAVDHDGGSSSDAKRLAMELQRRSLHESLAEYYRCIDAVRRTHSSLKTPLSIISKTLDEGEGDAGSTDGNKGRHRPSSVGEAFSRHIELSERVIRTVMRSPRQGGGPCGVLHENGIVRTSTAADHETNIVALASLRASVSRLKAEHGGGSGS